MIGHGHTPVWIAALCAMIFSSRESFAASAADLVKMGNHAFHAGKYDDALTCYEKASVEAPESAHIYFNKGAARFRKGNYREAAELFQEAALKTKNLKLEATSRYNQGNCMFRESERQRDSDLQKSLEALRNAVDRYQQALKLDPALKDAAHNIEVSRLIMKQILDELKRQQEQAKQEQQDQQKQTEKLKELVRQQEDLAARTEALGKESSAPDLQNQADALAAEQNNLRSETEKLADQLASSQATPDANAAKAVGHLKAATAEQSAAGQELADGSPDQAHGHQENAVEEMKKALGQMSGGSPDSQQQNKTEKPGPQKGPGAQRQDPQTGKSAATPRDKTAHDILDQEKKDRERRVRGAPAGYRPVDKDW